MLRIKSAILPQCKLWELLETQHIMCGEKMRYCQLPIGQPLPWEQANEALAAALADGKDVKLRFAKLAPPWTEATYLAYHAEHVRKQRALAAFRGVAAC